MPSYVSDAVIDLFAVVGTHEEIAERLTRRFGDAVTSCESSLAVKGPADRERLAAIVKRVHTHALEPVRQRLSRRQRHDDVGVPLGLLNHHAGIADLFQQPRIPGHRRKVKGDLGRTPARVDLSQRPKGLQPHRGFPRLGLTGGAVACGGRRY